MKIYFAFVLLLLPYCVKGDDDVILNFISKQVEFKVFLREQYLFVELKNHSENAVRVEPGDAFWGGNEIVPARCHTLIGRSDGIGVEASAWRNAALKISHVSTSGDAVLIVARGKISRKYRLRNIFELSWGAEALEGKLPFGEYGRIGFLLEQSPNVMDHRLHLSRVFDLRRAIKN